MFNSAVNAYNEVVDWLNNLIKKTLGKLGISYNIPKAKSIGTGVSAIPSNGSKTGTGGSSDLGKPDKVDQDFLNAVIAGDHNTMTNIINASVQAEKNRKLYEKY